MICIQHSSTITQHSTLNKLEYQKMASKIAAAAAMEGRRRPVALFLNASRLDYDNKLDFRKIQELCDFHRHDTDYVKDQDEMVALVEKYQAEIVITKETLEKLYGSDTGLFHAHEHIH